MKTTPSRGLSEEVVEEVQSKTEAVLSREEISEVIAAFKLLSKWRDEAINSPAINDKSSRD